LLRRTGTSDAETAAVRHPPLGDLTLPPGSASRQPGRLVSEKAIDRRAEIAVRPDGMGFPMQLLVTPVELKVPGNSKMLRLVRLGASGIAAACGLSPEEIEDYTLLTDEICGALIEASGGSPVCIQFRIDGATLLIEGTTPERGNTEPDTARTALSQQLLDVLAESHWFTREGGSLTLGATVRLRARGIG
jgi:anti-sigma regulatory factor (Ser/Thr protein kinase)